MQKMMFLFWMAFFSVITAKADTTTLRYGKTVDVRTPVYGDLYIAAGTVTINAPVYGELVVAGGNVFINDTVKGDIVMVAGSVVLNSYTGDDVRCLSGSLRVNGKIAGDLVAAGGEITLAPGAEAGQVLGAGGNVVVKGNVQGNVKGSFGAFVLNGDIGGSLDCSAEEITIDGRIERDAVMAAGNITTGVNAFFAGNLRYWNRQERLALEPHQLRGTIELDRSLAIPRQQWYYLGAVTALGFLWYLGVILSLLLVIQWLLGRLLRSSAVVAGAKPLRSVGYGLLFVIGVPLAAVLVMCTVVGIPIGILGLGIYILVLVFSTLLIALVCANLYAIRMNRNWGYWKICLAAFAAYILLRLVFTVPFLGWAALVILALWALGAIATAGLQYYRKVA